MSVTKLNIVKKYYNITAIFEIHLSNSQTGEAVVLSSRSKRNKCWT